MPLKNCDDAVQKQKQTECGEQAQKSSPVEAKQIDLGVCFVLIEQQRCNEETTEDEKYVNSEITATKEMINESDPGQPVRSKNSKVTN